MSTPVEKSGPQDAVPSLWLKAGSAFALAALVLFLWHAWDSLHMLEFCDETEKFVGAQLIHSGMRLYKDIFAHHGPMVYILSHLYTLFVSAVDFSYIRVSSIILALFSAIAIYFSPILRSVAARLWAVGMYLSLLTAVWVLFSIHMVLYYQLGGFLLVIPVVQLFLPLFLGVIPSRVGVGLSGVCCVLVCFTAYAFGPSVVLLVAASTLPLIGGRDWASLRRLSLPFFVGMGLGLGPVLLWFTFYGDIIGFFVYHFYFNQAVYSQFVAFTFSTILNYFPFSFTPDMIMPNLTILSAGLWILVLMGCSIKSWKSSTGRQFLYRTISRLLALFLLICAFLLLNPRGSTGFQMAAMIILDLTLFSTACTLLMQICLARQYHRSTVAIGFLCTLSVLVYTTASYYAVASPRLITKSEMHQHKLVMKPMDMEPYITVRARTGPDQRILSLIFNPAVYILSGRLPASGSYYYLPWQAEYNKNPLFEYSIDICKDINTNRPEVIFFDNWKVVDRYFINNYAPCVTEIIKNDYIPLEGDGSEVFRSYYIRKAEK